MPSPSPAPKTVLITGANTGIGLEAVRALLKSQSQTYHVLLCGRSFQKAQDAVAAVQAEIPDSKSKVTALQLDVTDDESIARAVKEVEGSVGGLDVLVNNAGASFDASYKNTPTDSTATTLSTIRTLWSQSWDTNVSGAHLVTHAFAPLLLKPSSPSKPPSRLIFLTSGLSSLTNLHSNHPSIPPNAPPPPGWPKPTFTQPLAYRTSKTGLNMLMLEWWRTLRNDGVLVWSVSPGMLATGLGGDKELLKRMGAGEASVGGEFLREVVEGGRDHEAGKVVFSGGGTQAF